MHSCGQPSSTLKETLEPLGCTAVVINGLYKSTYLHWMLVISTRLAPRQTFWAIYTPIPRVNTGNFFDLLSHTCTCTSVKLPHNLSLMHWKHTSIAIQFQWRQTTSVDVAHVAGLAPRHQAYLGQ